MHILNELSSSCHVHFPLDPRQDVYEIKGSCYEKRNNFVTANWPRYSPYTTFRQLLQISEVKMKIREYFLKDRGCMFQSLISILTIFHKWVSENCLSFVIRQQVMDFLLKRRGKNIKLKGVNCKMKTKWKIYIYIFTWYDLAFVYLMNIDIRLKTVQVIKGFERFIFNAFLLAWDPYSSEFNHRMRFLRNGQELMQKMTVWISLVILST